MARFGIDLGTTFSSIAYYDVNAKRVTVIPDEITSQLLVPSAVYYPETGVPIVGQNALNMAAQDPDRLVRWIKMSMGTDFKKKIGDKEYTPEQVSAEILKKLKHNAEVYMGEEVEAVVVTVPAYFGDAQRHATMKAAELAGLNVVRLLAEPSAAALAYVIEATTDVANKNVLVSDLGGGTYDITLLQTQATQDKEGNPTLDIRIVCKEGSWELGGKLWDDALEGHVVEQCLNQGHVSEDPRNDARLKLGLRERVIKGKEMLSEPDTKSTKIICDMGNTQEVSREKFEELTAHLLMQVETKLRTVLEQAEKQHGISLEKIDPILLAGGSSRMPMVQNMIKRVTGKQPKTHRNVDLVVSIGAAYDVYIASSEPGEPPIETRVGGIQIVTPSEDIARMAVGVKATDALTRKEINAIVIPDESAFEEEFIREDLATLEDNQKAIDFDIYEGDSENLSECVKLATVTLPLPPKQPKGTRVKVTLKYNKSGIIEGKGVCFTSAGEKDIKIEIDRRKIAKA
jgi:molecular chaperone DnaK